MLFSGTGSDWYFEKPDPDDPDPADPVNFTDAINGGAYFGGHGLLVELGGDEAYRAGHVGVNGGGLLASPDVGALLIDLSGDDLYEAGDGATNGGAIGGGPGLLIDVTGDDTYTAGDRGTNGGNDALAMGAGLVDLDGNDAYTVTGTDSTNGAVASFDSGFPGGIAFLFDTGGADAFDEPGTANDCADPGDCTIVPRGILGARIEI